MPHKHAKTQYVVRVWAGGYELSTFVTQVKVVNSIHNCWPIVYITFRMDDQEIIENNIYGQEHFSLKIWLTGETGELTDPKSWELVYLESNLDLPTKKQDNVGNYEETLRRTITVATIPKPSLMIMTCFVNKIWEEPTGMYPLQFIKEVLEEKGYYGSSIVRDIGFNEFLVDQLIIPPMTIKNMVDYINEKFSIYYGPMFRYCHFGGHFLMWDLHETYNLQKGAPPYVVYHKLPGKAPDGLVDTILDLCTDGKNYCGYEAAETIHHANSNLIQHGYTNLYIHHPKEELYKRLTVEADAITSDYGIWHDNDSLKVNPDLKSRRMYFTDSKGLFNDGVPAWSLVTNRMADQIKAACAIRVLLKRNINVDNVMKVGEVMYYETYQENERFESSDYTGAYIIETSDLTFRKSDTDNYLTQCLITGCRSVQTKK